MRLGGSGTAGYAGDSCEGSVGVYGGATINTYLLCNLMHDADLESLDLVQLNVGNSHDFLTTRVSYKLNLRGPVKIFRVRVRPHWLPSIMLARVFSMANAI